MAFTLLTKHDLRLKHAVGEAEPRRIRHPGRAVALLEKHSGGSASRRRKGRSLVCFPFFVHVADRYDMFWSIHVASSWD